MKSSFEHYTLASLNVSLSNIKTCLMICHILVGQKRKKCCKYILTALLTSTTCLTLHLFYLFKLQQLRAAGKNRGNKTRTKKHATKTKQRRDLIDGIVVFRDSQTHSGLQSVTLFNRWQAYVFASMWKWCHEALSVVLRTISLVYL